MTVPQFREKFIAYVDILGFKSKIESADAELGDGLSLSQLLAFLTTLEGRKHSELIRINGPTICPESRHIQRDLDYRVTQTSDCVIVSAEVSPAGIIHIIGQIQGTAWKLLMQGVMLRGYITRGNIFHEDNKFLGPGYHRALEGEKKVTAFQGSTDDIGTPFIEIDPAVVRYINECDDECVKTVFMRITKNEDDITAIFPFQKFSNLMSFGIDDLEKSRQNLNVVRSWICSAREKIELFASSCDSDAFRKSKYYLKFLDDELAKCNQSEQQIDLLQKPFPSKTFNPEEFPGLFH